MTRRSCSPSSSDVTSAACRAVLPFRSGSCRRGDHRLELSHERHPKVLPHMPFCEAIGCPQDDDTRSSPKDNRHRSHPGVVAHEDSIQLAQSNDTFSMRIASLPAGPPDSAPPTRDAALCASAFLTCPPAKRESASLLGFRAAV